MVYGSVYCINSATAATQEKQLRFIGKLVLPDQNIFLPLFPLLPNLLYLLSKTQSVFGLPGTINNAGLRKVESYHFISDQKQTGSPLAKKEKRSWKEQDWHSIFIPQDTGISEQQ